MKASFRAADAVEKPTIFGIESYGVPIHFEIDEAIAWSALKKRLNLVLPNGFEEIRNFKSTSNHRFKLTKNPDRTFNVAEDGEEIVSRLPEDLMFEQLERRVRLIVAEFAVGKVFLHAGVVAWKNEAIVIPAKSFDGKTTLVSELVKKGAVYYSDEYAVIDEEGFVHPFPKMLSMRGIVDAYRQVDVPVETFGGTAGREAVPVAMVLLTRFQPEAKWLPKTLSPGQAMMEILAHTLPIRNKPEFTLKVLNNMVNRAIITKTGRGDAARTADLLIGYFEKKALKS